MKFLARAALLSLFCMILPLSMSYAQSDDVDDIFSEDISDDVEGEEGKEKNKKDKDKKSSKNKYDKEVYRNAVNSCGKPISGTVPKVKGEFCDIYQRQLAFRNSAIDLRESLEDRRISFSSPRDAALNKYREDLKKMYKKASAKYAREEEKRSGKKSKEEDHNIDDLLASDDDPVSPVKKVADSTKEEKNKDDAKKSDKNNSGLKEKEYPPETDDDGGVKKKVIMPEDAPDFDESPF